MQLHGPATMLRVDSEAAYRTRIIAAARKAGTVPAVLGSVLTAYVNNGRWVADCPCGAGVSIHPDWQFAGCLGCFGTFTVIRVPADWQVIERALLVRPITNRHWLPFEDLDDLQRQNVDHDLPRSA